MAVQRERVIRAAEKYVSKGRIEAAIREYRKVLTESPDDVSTLNRLGDLYARVQQYDEAVRLFERIAAGYSKDGFLVKAIAIYKKIIKLDPTRLEIYEKLAELYHRQGLVPEARSQYQVLADYYTQHDNNPAALAIYHKLVELEPENPSHHAKLAEMHTAEGRVSEALSEYRTIAQLMIDAGHGAEAAQVFGRALDVSADDADFVRDAVTALRDGGHPAEADGLLALAAEKNPVLGRAEVFLRPEPSPGTGEEPEVDEIPEAPEPPPTAVDASDGTFLDLDSDVDDLEELGVELTPPVAPGPAGTTFLDEPPESPGLHDSMDAEPVAAAPTPDDDPLEFELDLDEVFELEEDDAPSQVRPPDDMLDGRQGLAFQVGGEPGPEPAPAPRTPSAPSIEATPVSGAEDPDAIVAEALVLHKYGMTDKAVSQLEAVLASHPGHADARTLLERIAPSPAPVPDLAAPPADAPPPGPTGPIEAAPPADSIEPAGEPPRRRPGLGAVDRMLRDLMRDVRPKRKKRPTVPDGEPAEAPAPPPAPVTPVEDPEDITLHGIFDEVDAGDTSSPFDMGSPPPEAAVPAAGLAAAQPAAPAGEDDEMSWLDTLDEAPVDTPPSGAFDDEDDFFDLAAELEEELTAEDLFSSDEELAPAPKEQSLEEIVEGFKRGVAENLSTEDYDTHFNLGIAYREMGLLDEAIGEFQIACKRPELFVECTSLLGLSFLEKGLPDLAVKSYRRGLEKGELTEDQTLGLMYDLAEAYLVAGDREKARDTFAEVYGINSHYRDVVARVEELR
jgi:tetratricopeptide (TPR) repeat protein